MSELSKRNVKANGLVRAARGSSVNGGDIGWAAEYHRRMRKFNLEAVLAASLGLVILIIFSSDELVGFLTVVCVPHGSSTTTRDN